MTTIANLRVKLTADSERLESGLARARESVRRFAVAGGAVATALGAVVVQGLRSSDELAKMATRAGTTTENLSALKFAAEQSGASLQDVGTGLQRMRRSVGEAVLGSKTLREAFDTLNIDLNQFKALDPAAQFAALADALNNVGDESIRAALGEQIFGRAFRQLDPLIRQGSQGMGELASEAAKLGATLDTEAARGAERALDALGKIGTVVEGAARTLAAFFAPAIEDVANWLADVLPKAIATALAVISGFGSAVGRIAFSVSEALSGNLSNALNVLREVPTAFSQGISSSIQASVAASAPAVDLTSAAEEQKQRKLLEQQLQEQRTTNRRLEGLGTGRVTR